MNKLKFSKEEFSFNLDEEYTYILGRYVSYLLKYDYLVSRIKILWN